MSLQIGGFEDTELNGWRLRELNRADTKALQTRTDMDYYKEAIVSDLKGKQKHLLRLE